MTRKELGQIYEINKEMRMWQRELERIQCKSLIKGQEMTGMPHVAGISDKVGDMAIEKETINAIIAGKLAEIQMQREKVIRFIDGVSDSSVRQILYYKYVSGMNWYRVASEMGEGYTADGVKMIHYRFMKKNNIT